MIYNSVRGLDSTGAASVKRTEINGRPKIVLAKELGHPFELLSLKRKGQESFDDVLAGTNKVLLGHCRAKTIGAPTRRNAHPFRFDNVVGTHNGTLSYTTKEALTGVDKFETDSETLYSVIDSEGIAAAVKKLRRPEDGTKSNFWPDAYALVWYDSRDNTLNFLRNQERPLYYGYSKDKQRLFWSSESGHLAAAMANVPHEDKQYMWEVPEDIHISWEIPNHGQQFSKPRGVRREATPDTPFVGRGSVLGKDSQSHRNNSWQHTKNTTNNASDWDDGDGLEPWQDPMTGMWKRFSHTKYGYIFANFKKGPYYNDEQSCWDALSEHDQMERIKAGRYTSRIDAFKKVGRPQTIDADKDLNDPLTTEENIKGYLPFIPDPPKKSVVDVRTKCQNDRFKSDGHDITGMTLLVEKEGFKAFYDRTANKWVTFTFLGFAVKPQCWLRTDYEIPPEHIPLPVHDINARHFYRHIGKKKRKQIKFVGFRGHTLSKEEFEKHMEEGCLNCSRKPQWGNWVRFLDREYFLCELCEKDESLVKSFKSGARN